MAKNDKQHKLFGLIGKNISYSFSRAHFSKKFKQEGLENHQYVNFDLQDISVFTELIKEHQVTGFNVTIPYKETIIPYLHKLNKKAKKIGAVNTIKVTKKKKLIGYNTDEYGFRKSLQPFLKSHHKKALILGTGGASKAIAFALQKLNIYYDFVSRKNSTYTYSNITGEIIEAYQIIINCTPLGTHPNSSVCPDIPYEYINEQHLLYDLIYNPEETLFLKKGKEQGATIANGHNMLILQAKKAWDIWNK